MELLTVEYLVELKVASRELQLVESMAAEKVDKMVDLWVAWKAFLLVGNLDVHLAVHSAESLDS